jgi:hypothetical protein
VIASALVLAMWWMGRAVRLILILAGGSVVGGALIALAFTGLLGCLAAIVLAWLVIVGLIDLLND